MKAWITAVPARLPYAKGVIAPGLERAGFEVVLLVDEEYRSAAWNSRRGWELLSREEVGVMVQDDVILHPQFHDHIHDVVDTVRRGVYDCVALYSPNNPYMRKQAEARIPYSPPGWPKGAFHYMQGNVYRGEAAASLLDWLERNPEAAENVHDDEQLSDWAMATRARVAYCTPALLNHREGPSAMGNPKNSRRRTSVWPALFLPGYFREEAA